MNLLGWAVFMVFWLLETKFVKSSMSLSLLFQSFVPNSYTIYLNSSMSIGSIGLETNDYFLKPALVPDMLKPPPLVALLLTVAFI
jgi:hypothetical protein